MMSSSNLIIWIAHIAMLSNTEVIYIVCIIGVCCGLTCIVCECYRQRRRRALLDRIEDEALANFMKDLPAPSEEDAASKADDEAMRQMWTNDAADEQA